MRASDAIALAARHGLLLDESSVTITEAGLDFRVAMAADTDGVTWVLRIPRRPGLTLDGPSPNGTWIPRRPTMRASSGDSSRSSTA